MLDYDLFNPPKPMTAEAFIALEVGDVICWQGVLSKVVSVKWLRKTITAPNFIGFLNKKCFEVKVESVDGYTHYASTPLDEYQLSKMSY